MREFLYLDIDRVKSLTAQLTGGVPESDESAGSDATEISVGIRKLASASKVWGDQSMVSRSLLDSLFPTLEEALEAEGWLADISNEFSTATEETLSEFEDRLPPGSLVRVTAQGKLFDSRYVSRTLGNLSVAAVGLDMLAQGDFGQQLAGSGSGSMRFDEFGE